MSQASRQVGLQPSANLNQTVFDWLPGRGVNPSLSSVQLTKTGGKSIQLRVNDVGNLDDTITTLMSHDRTGIPLGEVQPCS